MYRYPKVPHVFVYCLVPRRIQSLDGWAFPCLVDSTPASRIIPGLYKMLNKYILNSNFLQYPKELQCHLSVINKPTSKI